MHLLGEISALGAAVLWSFSSILFTSVAMKIGSVQLSFWRLIFAVLLLGITLYFASIPFDFTQNQIIFLSLSGIIGLVIGDTFLFTAFKEIGPRISMLIMSSNPAMAALIAYIFLDESLSLIAITGMIVTLIGIYIVIGNRDSNINSQFKLTGKGIIFGFLGALGQAVGLIFAKFAFNDADLNGLAATQMRIISAIIVMFPLLLLTGKFKNPVKLFGKDYRLIGTLTTGSIIGPYLGITLSYIAIIYTKIGIAATLMSLVPILMLPLTVIVYKEKLTPVSIAGAVIAVIGVVILLLR